MRTFARLPEARKGKAHQADQHHRPSRKFGDARAGRVGERDRHAQIVGDDVYPEGIADEGIITPLEAVSRALCCERIGIGQRIAGM